MNTPFPTIHTLIFWISITFIALSLLSMLTLLFKQHRGTLKTPNNHSIGMEMLWALVPLIMIIILILPALGQFLDPST